MSRENVEIVREFNALFEAGDRRSWRSYFDPNAIWDTSESGILPSGVYRGHAGIEQFFTDWLSTWDDYAIENREFIDGGDAVAVVFRQRGRGKGSGIETERDFYGVYYLRGGKVIRYRLLASRTQALEAVGLRE
jgi:ketosteroid isomerase-like protein